MLIREKDRQLLLELFKKLKTPVEVWAYGSRVNGTAHAGSDLDLVIRTKSLKAMPYEEFIDLVESIKESNIPILVEIRDWANLPLSFHEQIERKYEVLFSSLVNKNE